MRARVLCAARGAQALALDRGAAVLPDDRGGEGAPGASHSTVVSRWLAMPIAATSRAATPALASASRAAVELGAQDVLGIVLDPVGRREVLRECLLGEAAHAAIGVEHDRARAGGALVEGEQVGNHGDSARG